MISGQLPDLGLTLAHAALVLPLRRLAPRWLDFPALVLGSMAPDALYYMGASNLRSLRTHRSPGSA